MLQYPGSFTILLFLIASVFPLYFTVVMLFIYSLITLSKTVILCSFSAKTFIKNSVSWAKCFSEQMGSVRVKNFLNTPIAMFWQMLKCGFIWKFVIAALQMNGLSCFLLLRPKSSVPYYHFRTLWYIVSAGLYY